MNASSCWAEEHVPVDVDALPLPLSPIAAPSPRPLEHSSSPHLLSASSSRRSLPSVDVGKNDLERSPSVYPDADGDERSGSTGSSRSNRSSASSLSSGSASSDHSSEFSCNSLSEGISSTKELCPSKSSMGSSSCCRPPTATYEKVLSLGCPSCIPCGRSSSDASLTVLLQVAQRPRRCTGAPGRQTSGGSDTSGSGSSSSERPSPMFGASALYNPLKLEQRQRHIEGAFRDFQVQSKSARHDIELNLPTHVRLRPGEGPPPSHGPWSDRRRPPVHLDNCVRPPPNRSPFTLSAPSCRKTSATLKTVPTAHGTHTTSSGKDSSNSSSNSNSHSGNRGSGEAAPVATASLTNTGGRCGRKTL